MKEIYIWIFLFFADGDRQLSLQSEIHSSIKSKKKSSSATRALRESTAQAATEDTDTESIDYDADGEQATKSNQFKNAFATYKLATSNKMHIGGMSSDSPIPTYNPGLGSSYEAAKVLRLDEEYR